MKLNFIAALSDYDKLVREKMILQESWITVDGKTVANIVLSDKNGRPNEEYYKWGFVFACMASRKFAKDYMGTEIYLPKGNKNSAPLKIDLCIFDDVQWIEYYKKWRNEKDYDAVDWLRSHIIALVEFKKSKKENIKAVFTSQIKAYMKECERSYCIGMYFDENRLFIFKKENGNIVRYDESKNQKPAEKCTANDLSLDIPDPYVYIPGFEDIVNRISSNDIIDVSNRTINDLQPLSGIHGREINTAMLSILRELDSVGLDNQRGYEIIIETLAMKIKDEKYSKTNIANEQESKLKFYVSKEEENLVSLGDENTREFVNRIRHLYDNALISYPTILRRSITWTNLNHVRVVLSVVKNLQDYTFINSTKTNINQLVFYTFANVFAKDEKGQFITPLSIVDFIVKILNPTINDTIFDPTVGIADFLSAAYLHTGGKISGKNLLGVDVDEQMIMLAELNMLLSGVEEDPVLKKKEGFGSLLYKFNTKNELYKLDFDVNKNGNWEEVFDDEKILKKVSCIATNPPFGENRKFNPTTDIQNKVANLYEVWNIGKAGDWIDPGILFLENAYRILEDNGRMGFVMSNSIASIDRWKDAREWLLNKMRIVAIFDLPENVFAETGVNTTIVFAYKPTEEKLKRLQSDNYEVFVKDIKKVGYEIRTSNKIKFYNELYKISDTDFKVVVDSEGYPVLDEEFTQIIDEFKKWATTQEVDLINAFLA